MNPEWYEVAFLLEEGQYLLLVNAATTRNPLIDRGGRDAGAVTDTDSPGTYAAQRRLKMVRFRLALSIVGIVLSVVTPVLGQSPVYRSAHHDFRLVTVAD
ncbi:uncharacterized protein METZ01_LOCUS303720, partial [marine metagenome]